MELRVKRLLTVLKMGISLSNGNLRLCWGARRSFTWLFSYKRRRRYDTDHFKQLQRFQRTNKFA